MKYRPNYIKARQQIQQAAEALATAGDVLFRAYQKGIPEGHPLLVAMRSLADLDRDTAKRSGLEPMLEVLEVPLPSKQEPTLEVDKSPAGIAPGPLSLMEEIYSLSTDLWLTLAPSTRGLPPGVPGPVAPDDPDYNPGEAALWGACEQLKQTLTWAEAIHARGGHLPWPLAPNQKPGPSPIVPTDPPVFPSEYQQEPPPPYEAPRYPRDVTSPGPEQQSGCVPSQTAERQWPLGWAPGDLG